MLTLLSKIIAFIIVSALGDWKFVVIKHIDSIKLICILSVETSQAVYCLDVRNNLGIL